ncbi:hypothetical protein CVT24_005482 [Panaeolus cyanescens]|uniref:Uncharacterized protein n=1 Tax=Panaeolus cyanescens TaxID=181874 RepID=A0A409YCA3_9AGAR|nr:hypothetical protein CVT24_005482 [Panaeolus cyanescens]
MSIQIPPSDCDAYANNVDLAHFPEALLYIGCRFTEILFVLAKYAEGSGESVLWKDMQQKHMQSALFQELDWFLAYYIKAAVMGASFSLPPVVVALVDAVKLRAPGRKIPFSIKPDICEYLIGWHPPITYEYDWWNHPSNLPVDSLNRFGYTTFFTCVMSFVDQLSVVWDYHQLNPDPSFPSFPRPESPNESAVLSRSESVSSGSRGNGTRLQPSKWTREFKKKIRPNQLLLQSDSEYEPRRGTGEATTNDSDDDELQTIAPKTMTPRPTGIISPLRKTGPKARTLTFTALAEATSETDEEDDIGNSSEARNFGVPRRSLSTGISPGPTAGENARLAACLQGWSESEPEEEETKRKESGSVSASQPVSPIRTAQANARLAACLQGWSESEPEAEESAPKESGSVSASHPSCAAGENARLTSWLQEWSESDSEAPTKTCIDAPLDGANTPSDKSRVPRDDGRANQMPPHARGLGTTTLNADPPALVSSNSENPAMSDSQLAVHYQVLLDALDMGSESSDSGPSNPEAEHTVEENQPIDVPPEEVLAAAEIQGSLSDRPRTTLEDFLKQCSDSSTDGSGAEHSQRSEAQGLGEPVQQWRWLQNNPELVPSLPLESSTFSEDDYIEETEYEDPPEITSTGCSYLQRDEEDEVVDYGYSD